MARDILNDATGAEITEIETVNGERELVDELLAVVCLRTLLCIYPLFILTVGPIYLHARTYKGHIRTLRTYKGHIRSLLAQSTST